tara:strand:- start:1454 stop:1939 length:486 start_codon:yes stop_codon:yes gene_type:complete
MKIKKLENGNIILKNSNDQIEHVIATDVFLQLHPRNDTAILISKTPNNQDTQESIKVFSNNVTSVNDESFTGSRNDLLLILSELFKKGGGNGNGVANNTTGSRIIDIDGFEFSYIPVMQGNLTTKLQEGDVAMNGRLLNGNVAHIMKYTSGNWQIIDEQTI